MKGGCVLLVDDDPLVLRALRRMLGDDEHRLILTPGPSEAELHLDDPELDVAVVDLVMGESSGLALLDRIKRRRNDVEVIVMTGHASVETAVRAMRRGAFDYLTKPFESGAQIRNAIMAALARKQSVGARPRMASPTPEPEDLPLSLDAYERSAVERALRECEGDVAAAARRLGIGRSTLYRKLAKHRVEPEVGGTSGVGPARPIR